MKLASQKRQGILSLVSQQKVIALRSASKGRSRLGNCILLGGETMAVAKRKPKAWLWWVFKEWNWYIEDFVNFFFSLKW